MTLRIDSTIEDAGKSADADEIVGNADGGKIEFYTGTPPASLGDSPGGTLLVTIDLPTPAFGAASAGVATLNGTPHTEAAVDDGTIGWARVLDSTDAAIWDESDVGTGGGNAIQVSDTSIVENQDLTIDSYTFTVS